MTVEESGSYSIGFSGDARYDAMVREIALECVENMTKKDKKTFCQHPRLIDHHFGYGLYIRNTFSQRFEDARIMLAFRDNMSRDVLREIRNILMPDYIPPDEWS